MRPHARGFRARYLAAVSVTACLAFSAGLASFGGLGGCVEGGAEDLPALPKADASLDQAADASDDALSYAEAEPIFEVEGDVAPGTIFDAGGDAPCTEGSRTTCATTCGTVGDVICTGGAWGKCTPKAGDLCQQLDCAGKGDGREHTYFRDADGDGHGSKTVTAQGCTAPTGHVTANDDCNDGDVAVHPGATEVCNGKDDDCDGKTDDLPQLVVYDLEFAAAPPCTTADMASCKRGAHEWCRAKSSCFTGGFGPVELRPTGGLFVCVGGATMSGGWSEANAAQPACADDSMASRRVCESAVHRAGNTKGFVSAVLQKHAPFAWEFLGLPATRAQVFSDLGWSELTSRHAGCVLGTEDSWDCNSATHRFCTSKGFVSGYGPVEYNTDVVAVVCVKS